MSKILTFQGFTPPAEIYRPLQGLWRGWPVNLGLTPQAKYLSPLRGLGRGIVRSAADGNET
jgi:hypothetical protein